MYDHQVGSGSRFFVSFVWLVSADTHHRPALANVVLTRRLCTGVSRWERRKKKLQHTTSRREARQDRAIA